MKFILFFLFTFFTFFYTSVELTQHIFCSNCKHFFVEKSNYSTIEAKCLYFKKRMIAENEESSRRKETLYLINGETVIKVEDKRDLYFCDTARLFDSMCGLEGKKFESKN
jgi:hypothetical protein